MKRLVFFVALVLTTIASSCEEHDVLSTDNLPNEISNYITTYFPESTVTSAIKEKEGTVIRYEITLSEGFHLEFNGSFNIIEIDGHTQLPDAVVPASIRNYITINYSSNYVIQWELDDRRQKVELNNGLDLEFSKSGDFIRIDY